jgi:hypothetical protein
VTGFRFQDPPPPPPQPLVTNEERCTGIVPKTGIPGWSRDNWGAASLRMNIDPDQAQLLRRPTAQEPHPREIFSSKSAEAALIRQWATQYSSR